jgi:hypothetical protein
MHRFLAPGELRLALRLIVKQPILSATIVLALATGICLATLGFTFREELLISIPDAGVWMPATIFLTLAVAGGIACWMPARRALAIRPGEALGAE